MSRRVVATLTLGCKLNQAKSQSFGRQFKAAGFDVIARPARADAYLVNPCTITHVADRKARRLIRMAKRLAPNAPVVVTGCYADWAADQIALQTGADRIINNAAKHEAPAALLALAPAAHQLGRQRVRRHVALGRDDDAAPPPSSSSTYAASDIR